MSRFAVHISKQQPRCVAAFEHVPAQMIAYSEKWSGPCPCMGDCLIGIYQSNGCKNAAR